MSSLRIQAGTSGTVTVASGCVVTKVKAHATSAGSLVMTPAGGSAFATITLPAAANWLELEFDPTLDDLVDGATLAFTGTDSFYVESRLVGGV
jgi:hypothetical protein